LSQKRFIDCVQIATTISLNSTTDYSTLLLLSRLPPDRGAFFPKQEQLRIGFYDSARCSKQLKKLGCSTAAAPGKKRKREETEK